ncbi:MAG TPA: TIGR03619 family F420-dependent LLM class oxidoreductase [Terriglobales bacterium]|jgi:probable F420-dependent oxidoreductase|nr:TIGR03619 family F420-dependent LLM class oxidoreductase [Terriglobales bacterium]
MKIGFALPNIGLVGTADGVSQVAVRAEALGYESLWTIERLLWPVQPQTPYPAAPDGLLPEPYKHILDPLDTLTFVAAQTKTIALGTSVLDIPYYNPVMLARRLTTLDQLSHGRLRLGLGLGWSKDEMDAAGASMQQRGARADEFLQVLKAIWTTNPAEFHGKFYQLPKSYIDHKPVQKPHPPIYMAAFAPAALKRVATMADGWNPVAIPPDGMAQMFGSIKQMAQAAGRDPSSLRMVVRANLEITDKPLGKERMIFTGAMEQIQEDLLACKRIGAHELFFDPTFYRGAQTLHGWLALMEQVRKLA